MTEARLLSILLLVSLVSVSLAVKEWKNFENGKVHSHKALNYKRIIKNQVTNEEHHRKEHVLHGHHGDKWLHHQIKPPTKQETFPLPHHKSRLQTNFAPKEDQRHQNKWMNDDLHIQNLGENRRPLSHPASFSKAQHSKMLKDDERTKYGKTTEHSIKAEKQDSMKKAGPKKIKKKGVDERKQMKHAHSLLRSISPKHHKAKKDQNKNRVVHIQGNVKAKEILKKLPQNKGQKVKKNTEKKETKSTKFPVVW